MTSIEKLFSLAGKTAIITGGAVNIGRAITIRLAEAGAGVAVIYHHSENEASDLAAHLLNINAKYVMVKADLTNENQCAGAIKSIAARFGEIDVLINNAGIFGLSLQENLETKDWNKVFDLNVKGLFISTRETLKVMTANKKENTIVNIASINGLHPGFGQTAHYDASKGAVIAYTRSLAAETAKFNIRVNAVAPGLVDSETLRRYAPELAETVEKRTPLQKIATHEDIANAVLFLASGASSHITGEVLVVDGGYLLS